MEEWQETSCGVSKQPGMLETARCGVSREAKRDGRANAHQAGRIRDPRMHIQRRRAAMKSCVRQVHLRQYLDEHDKKQQAHQN